ncbi:MULTISPECIES: ScbR family autoregulator-binding transcription factor [Streptomyces]|uniref:ScbR family autoregulator-binding transcription factor n=1 Tax=Streptomyces glycanivorans TaxID=3033808 RepID=A0ABY9JHN4_9ACTN|nr:MULTISPECIES: ScbR family autoregulator-binding transcription factor [unclassified Streptomyces]WSQ80668.1 TetR/AcrR family transcriptional regulator [Streptomyces sp. NBC_01213]TXS07042.1 TetR/AcrR family transcriptional regulator [Streptomyces sp. wa22]WLQ67245.1 ScbR family autoregulator-binding transcription factor [Streptomyces sp. Alt3]WSQ88000.1 TetR/AcrR family transcriptional regulator [Streptomyces sp. NBC_01212]WSR05992.1 TetR/AcrR family transcriptional regulator [Streptomyces s
MSSSQPQASPQGCSTAHPPPVACGARKQERSVRTRRALIHSAAERFERHGYERTKLSEVSEGAGVTTGALHFHFRNKADLAEAVEYAAIRNLYRAARRSRRDRTDALTELTSLSYALAQLLHRDVVSRAGFRLNYETSGRTRLSIHQEWQGCVQRLLVQAGEEAGSPLGPLPLCELTDTVVGATTGFALLARDNRAWLSPKVLTGFWRAVLPGRALESNAAGDA